MSEALELFRCREKRKVDDEFCDVRINNRFFAAELKYRGDQVLVSYDPFSPLEEVRLYSLQEQFLQVAPHYQRERGTHPASGGFGAQDAVQVRDDDPEDVFGSTAPHQTVPLRGQSLPLESSLLPAEGFGLPRREHPSRA